MRVDDIAARVLAGGVRGYQLTLRAVIGANCRFEPSCSHYAIGALHTHGALRGTALTAARILRCNPWHPGGYDPVPPCATQTSSSPIRTTQTERTAP